MVVLTQKQACRGGQRLRDRKFASQATKLGQLRVVDLLPGIVGTAHMAHDQLNGLRKRAERGEFLGFHAQTIHARVQLHRARRAGMVPKPGTGLIGRVQNWAQILGCIGRALRLTIAAQDIDHGLRPDGRTQCDPLTRNSDEKRRTPRLRQGLADPARAAAIAVSLDDRGSFALRCRKGIQSAPVRDNSIQIDGQAGRQ